MTDSEQVLIGQPTEGDLRRLLDIRHAAFSAHARAVYSPVEVETLLNDVDPAEVRGMIRDGHLFVAYVDDHFVGLAGWKDTSLRHVHVDPSWTRRGIATKLLAHVEADFKARTGAEVIRAGVAVHARGFYKANGYDVGKRAKAWDGSDYFKMIKRL